MAYSKYILNGLGIAEAYNGAGNTPNSLVKRDAFGELRANNADSAITASQVGYGPTSADDTCFISFFGSVGPGFGGLNTNAGLTYDSTTNSVGATFFIGALTGNASTASSAPAGTLTGTTLKNTVVTSSLTSIGAQAQALDMNSHKINNLTDPSSAQDAATKNYVDNALATLDSKPSVAYASTSALPSNTYNNGTLGVGATLTGTSNGPLLIDGVTILVAQAGERVLVAGEAAPANNGWYTITQVGVLAVSPYILTRATESDQAAEIGAGYLTSVTAPNSVTPGNSNNGKVFISIANDPFTVGTTSLTFSQVGGTYSAGTGLTLSGSTFSITARNIGGVSFNGSGDIVPQTIQSVNEASDTTCFLLFISGSGSQSLQPLNNANLRYNASTNLLSCNLLSVDNGGAGLTGTNAALIFGASGVGDGNYINFGSGGRNIGVFNGGNFFLTANADYDATNNVYKYNSSNPATAIEAGTASIDLKYAVSGTSGNNITFLNGLSISVAGAVSIPNGDLSLTRSNSGGDVNVTATNSSNTASSNARLNMSVAGSSAGDPYITYDISGVGGFCHGVDNSDSDAFVIAASSTLGTTNVVRIDGTSKDVGVVAGNLAVQTIGKGVVIKSGSNARIGTGTLSSGSLAVPNTSITANTRIFPAHLVVAGTQGFLKATSIVINSGFTITSSSGTDTSTVSWLLVESS